MERGWFKIWREIDNSEIFNDANALRVFIYLLCNIDRKTGSMRIGRFWLAERLGLNSNTIYKILKRLEKKYKMVTQSSNNRFTTITLLNWAKYQESDKMVTQSSNNKVTTGQQQSNTLQEVENIELRNTERELSPKNSYNYLENIPQEDLISLQERFHVTEGQIRTKAQQLLEYCRMHGKKYRDYQAFLRNAISKDFKAKIKHKGIALSDMVPNSYESSI